MPLVCVDGAAIKITVNGAQQLVKTTDNIPSATKNKLSQGKKPVLTEDDVKQWLQKFQSNYDNAAFKGGIAMGKVISGKPNLTVKGKSKTALVTKDTKIMAMLQVSKPAQDPQGVPDPVPVINISIEFTDAAQTKLTIA
ncbi:hypothetical protein J8L98_17515 [Pseudoalteromonas sp. MMG013]|uniref:hypothetical protein n=1 Tax=Pseudoalteromonas sp. MMG013 TaxID=2822687 RepID=UPI001B373B35|nr:hypothetical protein [Pseudoalteromonas sp. MMG013]MBQ4863483.1 hypothetical protein [Pseudoalteromonas sp. MMG013]